MLNITIRDHTTQPRYQKYITDNISRIQDELKVKLNILSNFITTGAVISNIKVSVLLDQIDEIQLDLVDYRESSDRHNPYLLSDTATESQINQELQAIADANPKWKIKQISSDNIPYKYEVYNLYVIFKIKEL